MVRSHREEQQVDLGGKIAAIARRSYQTALRIDADGNHEAAAWLPAADVGNDLPARQPADHGEVPLQPLRKLLPSVPPGHFDRGAARRIAQADESKIEAQGSDQDVGKAACDVARLAPYPRHRQSGNRQQIPQRRSQPQDLAVGFHLHSARHCALARRLPLANLAQKLVRRNEERILVQ